MEGHLGCPESYSRVFGDSECMGQEGLPSTRARSLRAVSEAPLGGIMDHIGVCGRFRYSDLKEATGYGI